VQQSSYLQTQEYNTKRTPSNIPKTKNVFKKIETKKNNLLTVNKKGVKKSKGVVGFQAFLKKKGKFVAVSPITSKGAALDIGTQKAKTTLGATFKIQEVTGTPIEVKTGGEFKRFNSEFRDYMIRKGIRVKLSDTYIQKSKYRLSTKQEVTSIQQAKNNKVKKWVK